jgi:hypothetical protein
MRSDPPIPVIPDARNANIAVSCNRDTKMEALRSLECEILLSLS